MHDTMEATRVAANAAKDSNTKLERGWVMVFTEEENNVRDLFERHRVASGIPFTVELKFSITNYGRSPAWITAGWWTVSAVEIEPPATMPSGDRSPVERMPLPPDGKRPHEETITTNIPGPDAVAVADGGKLLVFFGVVTYRDVFGTTHNHAFAWQWRLVSEHTYLFSAGPAHWTDDT